MCAHYPHVRRIGKPRCMLFISARFSSSAGNLQWEMASSSGKMMKKTEKKMKNPHMVSGHKCRLFLFFVFGIFHQKSLFYSGLFHVDSFNFTSSFVTHLCCTSNVVHYTPHQMHDHSVTAT